jgi:hypothetical protein
VDRTVGGAFASLFLPKKRRKKTVLPIPIFQIGEVFSLAPPRLLHPKSLTTNTNTITINQDIKIFRNNRLLIKTN